MKRNIFNLKFSLLISALLIFRGNTVNTASRIVAVSETGRINLSGYAYDLIKDRFPCEYRGRVNAKGKGEIDMYYINQSSQ